jgi:hypothetical protein
MKIEKSIELITNLYYYNLTQKSKCVFELGNLPSNLIVIVKQHRETTSNIRGFEGQNRFSETCGYERKDELQSFFEKHIIEDRNTLKDFLFVLFMPETQLYGQQMKYFEMIVEVEDDKELNIHVNLQTRLVNCLNAVFVIMSIGFMKLKEIQIEKEESEIIIKML